MSNDRVEYVNGTLKFKKVGLLNAPTTMPVKFTKCSTTATMFWDSNVEGI